MPTPPVGRLIAQLIVVEIWLGAVSVSITTPCPLTGPTGIRHRLSHFFLPSDPAFCDSRPFSCSRVGQTRMANATRLACRVRSRWMARRDVESRVSSSGMCKEYEHKLRLHEAARGPHFALSCCGVVGPPVRQRQFTLYSGASAYQRSGVGQPQWTSSRLSRSTLTIERTHLGSKAGRSCSASTSTAPLMECCRATSYRPSLHQAMAMRNRRAASAIRPVNIGVSLTPRVT